MLRPTKPLQKHLVGEPLTETPLCPGLWREVLGLLVLKRPRWTNGCCSAPGGNGPEMVQRKETAHLGRSERGQEPSEGTSGTGGQLWPRCELVLRRSAPFYGPAP